MSANSTATRPLTKGLDEGWRVVAAAFCGALVGFGSLLVFTFSIFVKPLATEFGWSRESISNAFGIAALMVAMSSPLLGRLLDRYGPRHVVLPCLVVFGLAFGSLSLLTPSLTHLYLTFFVIGVVGNGTTQMGYSRAVASWFVERRGLALALVVAGAGAGSIVLPPAAQWLISTYNWRTAYQVLGAAVLVVGLPLSALYLRERPRTSGTHQTAEGSSVKEGLLSEAFWLLVATLMLTSIAVNGAIAHLSPLLTDRGLSAGSAALAVSLLGVASLTGRLVTGLLLDRYFGPRVSFALLLAVTAGLFLLAQASGPVSALVATALIGLGLGGEADVTPYLLTRYFGLRTFSTLYGLTWTAYAIAGALGPVWMGRFFDETHSYASLLLILGSMTLVSALLTLLLPAYPDRVSPLERRNIK